MYIIKTSKDGIPIDLIQEDQLQEHTFSEVIKNSDMNITPENVIVARIDQNKLIEYVNDANDNLSKLDILVKTYTNFLEKVKNTVDLDK
jgi:tetrahydromethanopterin S-methyltransferase subunit B